MAYHIKTLINAVIRSEKVHWRMKLLQEWPTIIGSLHTHVHLEKIYDDMVVLGVYDSCWFQQIHCLSELLQLKINKILDKPRIKQVRLKMIGKKTIKNECLRTMQTEPQPHVSALSSLEFNALSCIKDSDLKKALEAFALRCHQERMR
jgi:Dna[CI] antecedent, DciA